MKKSIFIAALIFSCLSIKLADAQIRISLNIGSQPEWGPTGYDHADYYYMPDVDAYYDVNAHQYVYYENNVWVRNVALPPRYHFDRYHSYKVVVNQPTPWVHHADIRARYANYRGRHDQTIIRESHDERYRNHWHDNGNHYGQQKDHGDRGHGHDKDRGDKGHDRD
ncbi:MAG: hypothetical protein M3O71_29870 [Bacteroidota bacterium]|nr:hypothetical protein [Bacteroidota bacterium]